MTRNLLIVWLPLLLSPLMALAEDPPDTQLFDRARANMVQLLLNQPNYVCIQTIDRSEQSKPRAKFEGVDSLRFEVAFSDHRELYAWPGSKKFDETNLLDLVPEGSSIGTGAFAGHAQMLFRGSAAIVNGGYWVDEGGKRMARFLFTVPVGRSHYQLLKTRKEGEIVGYSGDIWIEPESARVSKITLHADNIPRRLGMQSTLTIIEYGEAKIGDRKLWLPAQSTEEVTLSGGQTDRNVTTFSACRAFMGESTLRFDDGPDIAAPPVRPAKVIDLQPGVEFEIQIDADVDSNKIHVGDAIPATLAAEMKQNGAGVFPKGTSVEMRIVRLQRLQNWIGIEVALGDVSTPATTAKLWALPILTPDAQPRGGRREQVQIDRDPKRPGLGAIFVKGNRLTLPKGFRMRWTVVEPPASTTRKSGGH